MCLLPFVSYSQVSEDSTNIFTNKVLQNIKVNMFPMMGAKVTVNYESKLNSKVNSSIQVGFDFLGVFNTNHNKPYETKGYALSLMYKRYLSSEKNALKGFYVFAESRIGFLNFFDDFIYLDVVTNKWYSARKNFNNPFIVGFFGIGQQYVLHNRFVLEMSVGGGAYIGKSNTGGDQNWNMTPEHSPFDYGFGQYPSLPIAGAASIKLGYQFGTPRHIF